jgi:hypothetical protein
MVAARGRFLSRGHYQRLAAAVQSLAARHDPGLPGLVVDLAGGAGRSDVTSVNYQLSLDHADLSALVSMGPSARHITPQQLAARIGSLPSPFTVTVDLQVRVLHRRQDHAGARTTPRS